MDPREDNRDMSDSAWRRWSLLVALLVLGSLYLLAFILFVSRSQDFIAERRNNSAADFSRSHAIPLPADLIFSSDTNNVARLGGGWNYPDVNGVWSAAKDAWVELAVHPLDADLLVRLNTTASTANKKNRIEVSVNGVPMGSWARYASNASEPIEIRLPRSLIGTGLLAIHIHTRSVSSPFRLGEGNDTRQLGVLLTSIQIRQAESAPAGGKL
jgi:hypothetical protein